MNDDYEDDDDGADGFGLPMGPMESFETRCFEAKSP